MTDKQIWAWIEKAEWKKDHNHERIGMMFMKFIPKLDCIQLFEFIEDKQYEIYNRFQKAWLGRPGIMVSDDGWSDLTWEVVGRGERFFKSITVAKLRRMVKNNDYHENFGYITQVMDREHIAEVLTLRLTPLEHFIRRDPRFHQGTPVRPKFKSTSLFHVLQPLLKDKVKAITLLGLDPVLDELISDCLKEGT